MPNKYEYVPSRERFIDYAKDFNLVSVYREVVADLETPVSVYAKVFQDDYSCLLESIEGSKKLSRYSFIAGDPYLVLKSFGKNLEIITREKKLKRKGRLTDTLREIMGDYQAAAVPGLPRFFGGAVGYLGYDCVRQFECLPDEPPGAPEMTDAFLIFPESVIVFDHYTSKLKVVVNARIGKDPENDYRRAVERIERLVNAIRNNSSGLSQQGYSGRPSGKGDGTIKSSISRQVFCEKVNEIKQYIQAGDILQAVLSQRLEVETGAPSFEVYRALRSLNPSPYMYYLNFGEVTVAGASPEMLVRLEDGIAENRPIAGTRPRGKTNSEDCLLAEELKNDPKERAEHVMLVDLGRNDLGKVCRYGSVEAPVFMSVEKYSHVMHLVSEVKGELAPGKDSFDAFVAGFPAGTVSGAPKIRAMEIIDQLEPIKRGPYAGAVGYFSYTGNMDTCINIRTLIFTGGKAYAQAGAGIVADSDPESEYEETLSKAKVLLKALEVAEEGLM